MTTATSVSSAPLELRVHESRSSNTVTRRVDAGGVTVNYTWSGDLLPTPVAVEDSAVLAFLFHAMRQGRPLRVRGAVSEQLLINLEEFQEAWVAWKPKLYRVIPIDADTIVSDTAKRPRTGVFAFSGGVDATFSLARHLTGQAGRRTITPVTALLVHGFDLPLASPEAFEVALRRARRMLEPLQVPLTLVRTDWKSAACVAWEMEYVAGLTACMHQCSGIAAFGVMGAGEDYANLNLPWSSNPITNPLLSGSTFGIHTEGTGLTRTARVAAIAAAYPNLAAHLRVCWEGEKTGNNCGRCEKCIRTKLNFMASGLAPLCFDRPPTITEIRGLRIRNAVQHGLLHEILETAESRQITEPWVAALSQTLRRNKLRIAVRRIVRRFRRV